MIPLNRAQNQKTGAFSTRTITKGSEAFVTAQVILTFIFSGISLIDSRKLFSDGTL
jgi:hypothetical protein